MNYYDVTYKTPRGVTGTHIAVKSENEEAAAKLSPVMLCYGTPWPADQFKVLNVVPSKNAPIAETTND